MSGLNVKNLKGVNFWKIQNVETRENGRESKESLKQSL